MKICLTQKISLMDNSDLSLETGKSNDHPEREYTQVSGNGRDLEKDCDMVSSIWQHIVVRKNKLNLTNSIEDIWKKPQYIV